MGELIRLLQFGQPWPKARRRRQWMALGTTYALGRGLFFQFTIDRDEGDEQLGCSVFSPRSNELVRCTPASLSAVTWDDVRVVVRALHRAQAQVLVELQDQRRVPAGSYSSA